MSEQAVLKWVMESSVQTFDMPLGARVVDVRTQHGVPTLWTLAPAVSVTEQRTFIAWPTGPVLTEKARYVGTAHNVEGAGLVFHIFEREQG